MMGPNSRLSILRTTGNLVKLGLQLTRYPLRSVDNHLISCGFSSTICTNYRWTWFLPVFFNAVLPNFL
ncbi:hypothetical protein Y032_0094g2738 [Ancylostoma ceylanicum]|uniref:Uncharacterized protein n=1 Tax=Ancylostoma ceylanicum TaxID=53326 RepID=A0A016TL28_9BILA|nr:hypothetical protein Y032_0094g2738 [Ancylostoma ceylanicum]